MLDFLKRSAASVPTPDPDRIKLYLHTDGTPHVKDETGTDSSLVGLTSENVQDIVGVMATDSPEIDFTYDDGAGTLTAGVRVDSITNAMLADMAAHTFKGNNTGATANALNLTRAELEQELNPTVYNVQHYGLVGDDSTDNLAAFNTLYDLVGVNDTIYFPPGTYRFSNVLTLDENLQLRICGAGKAKSLIKTTHATAHIFNISISAYYYSFEDLGFRSSVTRTGGSAINATNDNALLDIRRCEFQQMFDGVNWSGVGAGNVGIIDDCQFNTPAANGSQIRVNGANINTFITNTTVNCLGVAGTKCLEVNQSGALQITTCDFIGGQHAMLVNATAVVSAIFCVNVFFDQSGTGSTVKFMGTGACSRIKFLACGITNGAANLAACEIAGTGTGTGIPEAIDFNDCDFYNNGFGGTTTGILVTGCRGFTLKNSRVAGFTNGLDITPYSANGITNLDIQGNTIGPTENFAGNGVGIFLRAGAVQYANIQISQNDLTGNTTAPITDLATVSVATGQKNIQFNLGMPIGVTSINRQVLPIATTYVGGLVLPPNSLRVGSHFRIQLNFSNTATASTTTFTLRWGVNGTIADAAVLTQALGAGTAVADVARVTIDVHVDVLSATVGAVTWHGKMNHQLATTGFTNVAQLIFAGQVSTLNTTTNANVLGLAVQETAGTVTLLSATIEALA